MSLLLLSVGKKEDVSAGSPTDCKDRHLLSSRTSAQFLGASPHRQVKKTDAFDSTQPDVDQSPCTDLKLPQELSGAPKEQRRPYDSQRFTSENDAARSQDWSTRETCISDRAAEAQYEAHSSRNDLHTGHGSNGSVPSQAGAGKPLSKDRAAICDMCMSNGTHICRNCFRVVCRKCKEICDIDLCSATKGQHKFKELKKKPQQQRSADVEGLSSQGGANVNEGMEDEGEEWSCSRCTYLNPADYRICTMCAASRGFSPDEQSEPGTIVCNSCTLHNKQGTKVCVACHKTIDLSEPPTSYV